MDRQTDVVAKTARTAPSQAGFPGLGEAQVAALHRGPAAGLAEVAAHTQPLAAWVVVLRHAPTIQQQVLRGPRLPTPSACVGATAQQNIVQPSTDNYNDDVR